MTEIKCEEQADRLRTRDLLAKADRFIMEGYSRHDAELLAQAEWNAEQEKQLLEEEKEP